jgi:hypothetical protein
MSPPSTSASATGKITTQIKAQKATKSTDPWRFSSATPEDKFGSGSYGVAFNCNMQLVYLCGFHLLGIEKIKECILLSPQTIMGRISTKGDPIGATSSKQ